MAKDYREIEVADILNYEHPDTAVMARYERIMQYRAIEAMNSLTVRIDRAVDGLAGVSQTIHRVGQLIDARAAELKSQNDDGAKAQRRQQNIVIGLTIVIAAATVAYTGITAWAVSIAEEANDIQRRIASQTSLLPTPAAPQPTPKVIESVRGQK